MENNITRRCLKFLITIIVPAIIVIFKPMGLSFNQSVVLGSLLLTIIWWATGIIYKDIASIFLILMFILFGKTPFEDIFFFPLSENFILVISSFLLSQGIVNSQAADKFSKFVLSKYCQNSIELVIMSFVLSIILIFIIPQPFPRVILLASIYLNLLKDTKIKEEEKSVIIFSIFVASTVTSLMLLNGDIIINYSALKFGEITMTYFEWAKKMTLPTLLTTIIIAFVFINLFKKNLKTTFYPIDMDKKLTFQKSEIKAIIITFLVGILWLTESMHNISTANVALVGVFLMFLTRIISLKDIKTINLSLLIFLTAEFSIGKVLIGSGVASKISSHFAGFLPMADSYMYLPYIVCLIMVLHLIMGSLVTALSVLIPTLISLTSGYLDSEFIVLLTVVSVGFHFIMPFHHVTIMIGYGNKYYENKHTVKIGIALTLITFLSTFLLYIPWWKIIGLT